MSGGQIRIHDTGFTWLDVPGPDQVGDDSDDGAAPESFHERLTVAGYVPAPICVIGAVGDAGQQAEVYEKESGAADRTGRFLVRLVVPGECEHIFTLADLPDLLGHFDRLAPLFPPLAAEGTRGRSRSSRATGASTEKRPMPRPRGRAEIAN
jgi:hypothetical protein